MRQQSLLRVNGWTAAGAFAATLLSAAAACSADAPSGTNPSGGANGKAGATSSQGGSAGTANSGGSSSSGRASGGSSGQPGVGTSDRVEQDPKTKDGACSLYAHNYCARLAYCQGQSNSHCFDNSSCPDLVFSTGSVRTMESVVACAREWATFSCEELAAGGGPDCAQPGTKQVGEACLFPSQCATLSCPRSSGQCSACAETAGLGAVCSEQVECPGTQVCTLMLGMCRPAVVVQPGLGQACVTSCTPDAYCSAAGKCEAPPAVGSPCGDGRYCDWAARTFCRKSDLTCQRPPLSGQPCAPDVFDNPHCDPSAECIQGMCRALPTAGEACLPPNNRCTVSHRCDSQSPDVPGICRAVGKAGETCRSSLDCLGDLACDTGNCKVAVGPEKSCADGATACLGQRTCDGTTCVPRENAGTFERACN